MGSSATAAPNDPFLIDECLSLDLVALAHARGHHATHVLFREKPGIAIVDVIVPMADLVNEVVEVFIDGVVAIREWPVSEPTLKA